MREIGSEFWLLSDPLVVPNERKGCFVLSGRTAIDLIIQDMIKRKPIRNVYLPAWSCESMITPFVDRGIQVDLYDVSLKDGLHYCVDEHKSADVFYVNNYFGYENTIDADIIDFFRAKGSFILYDKTHSFLMSNDKVQADYTFASIRKWMGVADGAIVEGVSDYDLKPCPYLSGKWDAMRIKKAFIEENKSVDKTIFLDLYSDFGHHLKEDYRNYEMDALSYTIYLKEDLNSMRKKRRDNARYLHAQLDIKSVGYITDIASPLFVPVFFNDKDQRDAVRKKLIDAEIYCPIHWPKNHLITPEMEVNRIIDTELSLICDQRYGINEMQRIIDTIQSIYK